MKKKIVIIDEELWFLDSIKELLIHKFDVEVVEFYDPVEAIQYIQGNSVNLIILDILLPLRELKNEAELQFKNAGGLFVLKKIKETNYPGNIICYTILTDTFIKNTIASFPNSHYLDKANDDINHILTTINQLII